jgi:GntR family transcriptional regulator
MASEGLQPYIAEESFKADHPSEREAELLRLSSDDIGVRLYCTAFDETGAPIEYTEAFYPSGLYDFHLTLRVSR